MTKYGRLPVLILALVLLTTSSLMASSPGSVGFSFLKVSWGARNAGMGDVGVALPSGFWGAHQNPASLAKIDAAAVGFMHQEYIFDTRREFLAGAVPTGIGQLSFGLDFFKVADLEYREQATAEPLGLFDAQEFAWFGGCGYQINSNLGVGLIGKYVAEKIESEAAGAVSFDFGATWKFSQYLTIGAAVNNLGSKPKFLAEEIDLPLVVAAGVGVHAYDMQFGADVSFPRKADMKVNLGVERYVVDYLALRAGYKFGYDEEDLAFGIGITKSIWQVDYAFVPYKSGLGSSHRFALTVYWR